MLGATRTCGDYNEKEIYVLDNDDGLTSVEAVVGVYDGSHKINGLEIKSELV